MSSKVVPFASTALPHSPYYKQTHIDFRERVRAFTAKYLTPFVDDWDEARTYPASLHKQAYDAGVLAIWWPAEYGGTPCADADIFHDCILMDELSRCGNGGIIWAVFLSAGVALPPILTHGSQFLKDKCARDVITGDKIMSLAISEPWAGSDVAALETTATRSADGTHYIITGAKKWITSGTRAHFFTVAARTASTDRSKQGGPGALSLFLVERTMPGVGIKPMPTQGMWLSGTAFIKLDEVRVPSSHLIGREGDAFKMILHNFNHERLMMSMMAARFARVCVTDAITFARTRRTFGRRLIEHQVIRHKIADMARACEAVTSLLESVAYQVACGATEREVGGVIALAKVQATRTMEMCAREASQVLGGKSYERASGVGAAIERMYREVRFNAIAGGSEEIMLDLAMRQARL